MCSKLCLNWKMAFIGVYVAVFFVLLIGSTISASPWKKNMFLSAMAMLGLFSGALLLGAIIYVIFYGATWWKNRNMPQYNQVQTDEA